MIAHALIDAILGAAGKGDIGELFPSADPQWLDVSSIRLLQRTYEVVRMAGFELVNADCVLIGERPRISELRVAMGARLAGAMGVDIGPRHGARDDDRRARLHRSRRGPRRSGRRIAAHVLSHQRQRERHARPALERAFGPDPAAVGLDEPARDR